MDNMDNRFANVETSRKYPFSEKEAKLLNDLNLGECLGIVPITTILKEAALTCFLNETRGESVEALRAYLQGRV